MSRAVRVLHFALLAGVVLAAAVFVFLVRVDHFAVSLPQFIAPLFAGGSIALLAFATFLRRRIPARASNERPDEYWTPPERRGAAIVLWAATEGAALLGILGYVLSANLLPGAAALLAIGTLAMFRPSYLEGPV